MKNLLLALIIFLLSGQVIMAQTDSLIVPLQAPTRYKTDMRGYVGLSGGMLFSTGKFNSTDVSDNSSGKAGVGFGSTFTIAIPLKQYLGFQLQAGAYSVFVQKDEYEYQLQQQQNAYNFVVESNNYTASTFMAGPYLTFSFGRASWDFKGLAGYATGMLPRMEIQMLAPNGAVLSQTRYNEKRGGGLCATVGTTVRMSIYKNFGAFLDLSYLWANMKYKNVVKKDLLLDLNSQPYIVKRPISGVNVSVGVALLLK